MAATTQPLPEAGCAVVLGIGGGSVIDGPRRVAAGRQRRPLPGYEGIADRAPDPPADHDAVDVRTGADVSQFCIVTDTERHTKITIMGRALVPDVSVIDPRLLSPWPEW